MFECRQSLDCCEKCVCFVKVNNVAFTLGYYTILGVQDGTQTVRGTVLDKDGLGKCSHRDTCGRYTQVVYSGRSEISIVLRTVHQCERHKNILRFTLSCKHRRHPGELPFPCCLQSVFFPLTVTVTEMSVNGNKSNTLTLPVILKEIPEKKVT